MKAADTRRDSNDVVAGDAGKRMQTRVWHDLTEVLCNQLPAARAALDALSTGGKE